MILRTMYSFFSSSRLALALLVAILASCLAGVTAFRGPQAWTLIFSSLWFNGLLVLLVVNVSFCFFGRIWGKKVTLISFGMILFHLSFVAMFGGIIYNSLFYFRGLIRLTEGEALPNSHPESYDYVEHGRFFDYSLLKGDTTLIRMHAGYKVEGTDKRAAYEIAVGEGPSKKQGVIYITQDLEYNGFNYYNEKEGYSLLIMLSDRRGSELYGAYVPLQSFRQTNDTFFYSTGTKDGPGSFPFPQEPLEPLFELQVSYHPDPAKERAGDVTFQVWPFHGAHAGSDSKMQAQGKAAVGEAFDAGNYYLTAMEVRYWVGMTVRYEPGKPIVLTSLWVGLGGMVITFVGRIRKRRIDKTAASDR